MSGPVVEIRDLHFAYGPQPVLSGVNLTFNAGDFVAFLGPNGGGKSTLVKLVLGLLKPDSGSVRLMGGPPEKALGRVGYVPQDTNTQPDFPITVDQVVLTGTLGRSGGRRWQPAHRQAARQALKRVGMWSLRHRRVGDLSGGQRQRVFIARALVGDPELLLLDEPTSSVDQEWQGRLFDLLRELNRTVTVIMVSHDLAVISSHVKSVACINREVHYHPSPEITAEMIVQTYHCPVELIAHGLPHRVLAEHDRPAPELGVGVEGGGDD